MIHQNKIKKSIGESEKKEFFVILIFSYASVVNNIIPSEES